MENIVNIAKINNNLRPIYVKEIIFEHTDETHFITVGEILEILESNYGISSCRKTIYDDIEMLINSGFDIECVSGKNNRHMYHVLTREFDLAEIRMLIDAIESLKSLSASKSMQLIKKLSMFTGPSSEQLIKDVDVFSRPKTDNPKIYYNIDTVYKAINTRKKINMLTLLFTRSMGASFVILALTAKGGRKRRMRTIRYSKWWFRYANIFNRRRTIFSPYKVYA